ncbi:MAG: phosphomannomutase/phosphoglucomutase [Deltaproteobacteria bacterium]|nr:phosphomannomutase/phosphoglucomutase [Deltaproteobacteria bacterium]
MIVSEKIFREYDIRGEVGKDIDRDIAISIGKAFASFVRVKIPDARCVSVGRDVRISSDDLASGVMEGIASSGLDVYDVGVCPTPLQYFSLFHLNLDGGIMVTGSHNPPEYNGFKISIGKDTIHGEDIQRIKEEILKGESVISGKIGDIKRYNITTAYKDYMLKEFLYLNDSRFKRLKIVVDAGNGTGGIVAPEILSAIGCEVTPLYCEPDGNFPNHHPDPTVVEYIQDLIGKTKELGADMGVGYDGDADRIGIVNRDGGIVWGDQLMIILSREILKQRKGAKIIADVKCSQILFDDVKNHGGIPIMWKTGHSLIKQKMRDEGAVVAGEFSGHIFIKDRYFGYDDAIYTTLRLVEIMKNTGSDIKKLLSDIPNMYYTPEIRIDCPDEIKKDVVKQIVSRFIGYKKNGGCEYNIKDVNTIDGVRITFENGWGLLRTSNTQPVVVMRVEAEDKESLNSYRLFLENELKNAPVCRQAGRTV